MVTGGVGCMADKENSGTLSPEEQAKAEAGRAHVRAWDVAAAEKKRADDLAYEEWAASLKNDVTALVRELVDHFDTDRGGSDHPVKRAAEAYLAERGA